MSDETTALTVLFTEFYYWVMIVLMFLIKVGFCVYEVAVSRYKNRLHTLMQVTMHIPLVTLGFLLFRLVDLLCIFQWPRYHRRTDFSPLGPALE